MSATTRSAWRWLDDRLGRPFLKTPPPSGIVRTIAWNSLAVLMIGVVGLLTLFLAPAYSDTYCSTVREPPSESRSWTQGPSYWPFGTRCVYRLPDGTIEVSGPGRASAVLSPVLVASWAATVSLGLLAPPTRFWRRTAWMVLSPVVPIGLMLASAALPSPVDGFVLLAGVCVSLGLIFAVLTAAITYAIHPKEQWWVFPGAWLGWNLAFAALYITFMTSA